MKIDKTEYSDHMKRHNNILETTTQEEMKEEEQGIDRDVDGKINTPERSYNEREGEKILAISLPPAFLLKTAYDDDDDNDDV